MKYIVPAAAIALAATQATAGSLVEPEMEPMVEVVEEESSSSSGWILPLLAIGIIAAVASSNSSSSTVPGPAPASPGL